MKDDFIKILCAVVQGSLANSEMPVPSTQEQQYWLVSNSFEIAKKIQTKLIICDGEDNEQQ